MTYAFLVGAAAGNFNGGTTAGIDTTGATLLVAMVADQTGTPTTPTDSKSNTWVGIGSYLDPGNSARGRLWYSVPSSVGASHTFTSGGSVSQSTIAVAAFSGASATPLDLDSGHAFGFGEASPHQPGSITPSQDNCLVITGGTYGGDMTSYAVSGYTQAGFENTVGGDHPGCAILYAIQTTATATNPSWTPFSGSFGAVAVASFKDAGGSTPGTPSRIVHPHPRPLRKVGRPMYPHVV